mgnify:FL=1
MNCSAIDPSWARWGVCNIMFPRCLMGFELQLCKHTCYGRCLHILMVFNRLLPDHKLGPMLRVIMWVHKYFSVSVIVDVYHLVGLEYYSFNMTMKH